MSKTSMSSGLALLCSWAWLGVAHAQTARDAQIGSDTGVATTEQLARMARLASGDVLTVPSALRGDWGMPVAPAASSAGALLASITRLPSDHSRPSSERLVLLLSWVYAPKKPSFSETQTFTKYQENTGSLDLKYTQPTGSGFSGDGRVMLWQGFGLQLGYSSVPRHGAVDATAQIPHPLLFQHNRTVSYSATGLDWLEGAFHLDAAYSRSIGPVRATIFAGASFVSVKADLATQLAYTQVYPYASENVTVTALSTQRISKQAVGPDAGVALDVPIVRHVGLGALVRYSGARVTLARPVTPVPLDSGAVTGEQLVHMTPGSSASIDARGIQLAVGARLFF